MTRLCKVCGEPIREKCFVKIVYDGGYSVVYHWECYLSLDSSADSTEDKNG